MILSKPKNIPFRVVIVPRGSAYGRPGTNGMRPLVAADHLVEFYDLRYPHDTEHGGQFVTRYHIASLLERPDMTGLCMDGGVPDWVLSAYNMEQVRAYLWGFLHGRGESLVIESNEWGF